MKGNIVKRFLCILVLGLFGLVMAAPGSAAGKSFVYQAHTPEGMEKEFDRTQIEIRGKDDSTLIKRSKNTGTCEIVDEFLLDKDRSLISWKRACTEEGTDFTALREGDRLVIKGTFNGEQVDKQFDLGGKYLHIYPKYSLDKFAFSGLKSLKFWSIRRDELTLVPMKAEVKGLETIEINGKIEKAVRVYYAIDNKLKERFFNHEYFFRASDGVFLKKVQQDGEVEILIQED